MTDVRKSFRDGTGCDLDEEQILLVGSNPLPVVVAALALRPSRGVHLVHTGAVVGRVERITKLLEAKGIPVHPPLALSDPYSAPRIREDLHAGLAHLDWRRVGLHYSGGTKPMAAAAHAYWSKLRQCPPQASYLGADAFLRFENEGRATEVSLRDDPRLTLAELTELHTGLKPDLGDEHKKEVIIDAGKPTEQKYTPQLTAARKIRAFIEDKGFDAYKALMPPIYGTRPDILLEGVKLKGDLNLADPENFGDDAWGKRSSGPLCEVLGIPGTTLDDVGNHLRGEPAPTSQKKRQKRRSDDAKWLWGNWLEVWLAEILARARDDDGGLLFHEVHQNVELQRAGKSFFEADVVAVRGHRAFLFSCTVDSTNGLVKHKLFEAGQRTAQLGGDHARFAIVSFHRDPDQVRDQLTEEGWDGYDTARSFGVTSADELVAKVRLWVLR